MSKHLHETDDSHRWAEEFVVTYEGETIGKEVSITVMLNWFAKYKEACGRKFKEKK